MHSFYRTPPTPTASENREGASTALSWASGALVALCVVRIVLAFVRRAFDGEVALAIAIGATAVFVFAKSRARREVRLRSVIVVP